ncbi:MAG TPA: cytochrome d ubiquinol oxidase subunit II [Ktedonobacteraceae bacterium]|jgi:cytochrome d ubiquinol oxidase subunit II
MIAYVCAVLLWLSLIAYAVFGGADFGGGIWDLFLWGHEEDERHQLIEHAVGPVWEANNVWLIYLVVGLYTAFPIVAAMLAITLFLPLTLALLGIVMRGAAFAFRSHFTQSIVVKTFWGSIFGVVSALTPFLLGTCAAAVASGKIRVQQSNTQVALVGIWLTPFALTVGLMGLALCATIAPIYLTVEAQKGKNERLANIFRRRAFIGGGVLAILGIAGILQMPAEAPLLWRGILDHAIWAVIVTVLLGIATALALFLRRYRLARALIVMMTAALLGSWGLGQFPYIVPPDLTIPTAASPQGTLQAFFVSALIGMLVLIPSLWFLFYIFKVEEKVPTVHEKEIES